VISVIYDIDDNGRRDILVFLRHTHTLVLNYLDGLFILM
jgi:hypothetical protein